MTSSESVATYDASGDILYDKSGTNATVIGVTDGENRIGYKIVIPAKTDDGCDVTSIKANAFRGYASLVSVTIPESVTDIGTTAFEGCISLTEIIVDGSNTAFSSVDGVLYDKTKNKLICCPGGKTSCNVESTVTDIVDNAFSKCVKLVSVTGLDNVRMIGSQAFQKCSLLESISIPEATSIGVRAFFDCTSLTTVTMPKATNIGMTAFYNCSSLSSIAIPEGTTDINSYVFRGCSSLESVTIPDSVTRIGEYAFYGCSSLTKIATSATEIGLCAFADCSSLTEIKVNDDNTNYSSVDGVLYDKTKNTIICCPGGKTSCTIESTVASVASYAFYGCSSLTTLDIPSNASYIGKYAFYGCTSLTSVTIPDTVTNIDEGTFNNCSSLASITMKGVKTFIDATSGELIPALIFAGCTSLTSITISNDSTTFESIDGCIYRKYNDRALVCCPEGRTSFTLDDSIHNGIEPYAFYGCTSLTSVTLNDRVFKIGTNAFQGCTSLTSVTIPKNIDNEGIRNYTFYGCTSLTSVTMNNVTKIGNYAFRGCSSLTSIDLSNVKEIGMYAFWDCTSLTSLTIPQNLTKILGNAFAGCSSLTAIDVVSENTEFSSVDGVLYNKDKSSILCCPGGKTGCTVESTVSKISSAFFGCTSLTSLTIPANVTDILDRAFTGCTSLTEINVDPSNTVYSSVDKMLYDKTGTELLCSPAGLKNYTISNNTTSIAPYAFNGNRSIESFTLPTSIKYVAPGAFGFDFYESADGVAITDYSKILGKTFTMCDGKMVPPAKVEFDTDGGSEIEVINTGIGVKITLPTAEECTKSGYELKGWTCDGTTYEPGAEVTVTGDMTFKAVWEEVPGPVPPGPEPEPTSSNDGMNIALLILFVVAILGVLYVALRPKS